MTRRFTPTLAKLVLTLGLLTSAAPVAAKTTTISNDASCTAAGGTVTAPNQCLFGVLVVRSGDTLTTAGNIEVTARNYLVTAFNVEKGATLNLNSSKPLTVDGVGYNGGAINVAGGGLHIAPAIPWVTWITNDGTITVRTLLRNDNQMFNNGSVDVLCGGNLEPNNPILGYAGNWPHFDCGGAENVGAVKPLPANVGTPDR